MLILTVIIISFLVAVTKIIIFIYKNLKNGKRFCHPENASRIEAFKHDRRRKTEEHQKANQIYLQDS
jgi:hypothetical protein